MIATVAGLAGAAPRARPGLVLADSARVTAALRPAAGRPRLVHLWASWCVPCAAELPALLAELRRVGARIDVVLLALDESSGAAAAQRLVDRAGGAPGLALRASPRDALPAVRALDREWDGAIPTTYLIASDGRLAGAQRGLTELPELVRAIDRLAPQGRSHDRSKP